MKTLGDHIKNVAECKRIVEQDKQISEDRVWVSWERDTAANYFHLAAYHKQLLRSARQELNKFLSTKQIFKSF